VVKGNTCLFSLDVKRQTLKLLDEEISIKKIVKELGFEGLAGEENVQKLKSRGLDF